VVQMDDLNCWQVQTLPFSWQSNRWESAPRVRLRHRPRRRRLYNVNLEQGNLCPALCVQHQIATTCRTGDELTSHLAI
jgi:hypothetical protein